MYHYFAATEIYNAIRVFIAAYVWMTGFGNFSYYYVRKDFSLGRFAQVHMLHAVARDKHRRRFCLNWWLVLVCVVVWVNSI